MKEINTKNKVERKTVLIIDDAEDLRKIYVKKFKQEGYEVLEANDGLDGLNVAFEEKPDLIITGIMMPRVDGFEVINTLKKDAQTKQIPVLVFSHLGRQEDIDKAMNLGADDFIIQATFSPDDVAEKVRFHLGKPPDARSASESGVARNYNLQLNLEQGDAPRLAQDFGFGQDFKCSECGGTIGIDAVRDTTRLGEWVSGFFKCLKCGKKP